jgi:hypothetical protein
MSLVELIINITFSKDDILRNNELKMIAKIAINKRHKAAF